MDMKPDMGIVMHSRKTLTGRSMFGAALFAGAACMLMTAGHAMAQADVAPQSMQNVTTTPLTMGTAPTQISAPQISAPQTTVMPVAGLPGAGVALGVTGIGGGSSSSSSGAGGVVHVSGDPPIPVASPDQLPQGDLSLSRGPRDDVKPPAGPVDPNEFTALENSLQSHAAISPPATHMEDLKTLFFTAWQYALLKEAKETFKTRPPTSAEMNNPDAPKPTGPREVSLGGISFRNGKDWTVWLNSQRIKPDAIPKEVLDIKVSSDHVDLKWFDNSTNLIFPIRLHPHERFNLDTRIFLPGAGT